MNDDAIPAPRNGDELLARTLYNLATRYRAERNAARAEADGLRAKIEAQADALIERCCKRDKKAPSLHSQCGDCPRRYIIELPERAKG